MGIGENIKRIRKEKKMTLKQLADIMGCSPQLVSQYETGKRIPKFDTTKKIAKALNTDIFNLLIIKEHENSFYDFTAFNYDEIKTALCDIVPGMKAIVENEQNECMVKLLKNYEKLNEIGKKEAIKRVEELTEIPRYVGKEESI